MFEISVTAVIATYGAVLSTAIAAWSIYRDLMDRGRLEVQCFIGKMIGGAHARDDSDYLVWTITNIGRRPLMVKMVGGTNRGKKHFIIGPRDLPKMLAPGEYTLEYSVDIGKISNDLKDLWALDSLGKYWKARRNAVKEVREALGDSE